MKEDKLMDGGDHRDDDRPHAFWRTEGRQLVLWVDGRRRANVDPVFNQGEVIKPGRPFQRPETEPVVTPRSRSILGDVEARLGLRAAVIIADSGKPDHELRAKIEHRADFHRKRNYPDTHDPKQEAVHFLVNACGDLTKAAAHGELDGSANDARFHCSEALRELERGPREHLTQTAERATSTIKKAIVALYESEQTDKSIIRIYSGDTHGARARCERALECLEKVLQLERENSGPDAPTKSTHRRPREREPDLER
jgi:hypothetical protein